MDIVEHSLNGPAENQGFHVNTGAFPGQGAGVPGSGPPSQQIRGLPMHSGTTLPPPPQQPPHPQPPPTPTSTPPASDMGKTTQIQQSVNFVPNPQRAQPNQTFYTRMSPSANTRMSTRPLMGNVATVLPTYHQYNVNGHVVQMPAHHHFMINTNSVPHNLQNPQFAQQRQHTQTAQSFYPQSMQHHITYPGVMPTNNQYFHTPSPNYFMTAPGNAGQFTPSVPIPRTGYTGNNQGQVNMQPTNVGQQPPINMTHQQPVVNQQTTQQAATQRVKRRPNAIPIIDPDSGNEVKVGDVDNSGASAGITPPPSNDSSARETPQPVSSSHDDAFASEDKLVRIEFAALVAAAVTDDVKQNNSSPSISETMDESGFIEAEITQTVPNSESVKISKLSSSHIEEYSSISQTSDNVKESTGHNAGPAIPSQVESLPTPIVSALSDLTVIQPNWPLNHAREQFPALKNTSSPTVLISSPVKNNVRKQTRINSESDKNALQEKIPQPPHPQPQPQQTQPILPSPVVINPVTTHLDHTPAPPAAPTPAPAPLPAQVPSSASTTTQVPVSTPVQKKEKNPPTKALVANVNKEDVPVTSQHPHPPPKERREKQRNVKETPPLVQQQHQQLPQTVNITVQPEPAPHKPSFTESISIKSVNQISPVSSTVSAPVVQTNQSTPSPVPALATVSDDKTTCAVQQQQTNGETPAEPAVDGKASQRQSNKKKPKMKDINRKGVEKEGTEMDAFTEANQDEKEKPALTTISNPPPALSNKTPLIEKISKDELEKKKIVAAKNEENAKVSALSKTEEDNIPAPIIEKSQPQVNLKHKYKDGQWSPLNPKGEKKYERDFLLGLQAEPQSMKKPENLPNLDVVLHDPTHRRISSQQIYPTNRGGNEFPQQFFRSGQSLSRGQISNRKSQQGNKGGKGSGKAPVMHISLSLKDEVKLRETENAWKPARFNSAKDVTEEDRKTQDLYKKVRSILNKLTPQKFETLVNQVKALPIDTAERLQGVIDLVFDKAIDEPGFAIAYANMCKLLSNIEVTVDEGSAAAFVFRKLLLARCQSEFESNNAAELFSEKRLQEIKECTDLEKKKELQLSYEEEERRIRRKSVGNIRFIGELYKLHMLTANIMHRCILHLLKRHEEESLECLCKLLTTIGKDLENVTSQNKENPLPSLDSYFDEMSRLAQKKGNSKISSRVRFMLQDVIELRQSKWIPRREDNNPTTIDQIQRDAERESMEMTLALSAPRKQDVRGNESDRKGRNRGNNQDDKDGWQNVSGKSFRPSHSYNYDPSRLQSFKQQPEMMLLGSASQYNQWGLGAKIKGADKSDNRIMVNNMYGPLSKERDGDKKHSNINSSRSGKMTPSPSIEKERMISGFKEAMDSDRKSHRVQQSSQPPSRDRTPTPARVNATSVPSTPAPTSPLTPEEIERKAKLIADEYLCNNNFEEAKRSFEELDSNLDDILYGILIFVINKNAQAQQASIGKLFADLIDIEFLSQSLVLSLYEKLYEQIVAEEWIIDVPLIWNYFSHLIAPLVKADKITFADLRTISKSVTGNTKEFFLPLIQFLCHECGENWVRSKWVSSRVQLSDFVANPNDPSLQKAVEFLSRKGDASSSSSLSLPMDEVRKKLVSFFQNDKMDIDSIFDWINTNVGEKVKEPQFIRALITAICQYPSSSSKNLLEAAFKKHASLIIRCVDQNEELQIECVSAIHSFINSIQHPSGLLMTIFNCLWDTGAVCIDSFLKWRDSEIVEEGKGVAVKSLRSFFTALTEGDVSDEAS